MKTKNLVMAAVLLAVGTILHMIPGIVNGVKPDFLLATLFFALIINRDLKATIAIGVVAAALAALTTSFPGGQIPSVIDKIITSMIVFGLIKTFNVTEGSTKAVAILTGIGTIISGAIFLGSAMALVGLPGGAGFFPMMVAIVLPTAALNTIFGAILCKVYAGFLKYSYA
ncbi:MAG: tryptophan transporter [Tissierellia bacterium]|nr:tryptophan transporter [Tissierellia bacterium]